MSEINNGGLDQYGAEPFEQQQFGTPGVEGVNAVIAAAEDSVRSGRDSLSADACGD